MRNPSTSASTTTAPTTTKTPCCSKVGLKRGPWTPAEDELLSNYIKKEGEGRWRTLPKRAGLLRCGKSCRLRWMNYLRPSVKRGQIAPDEEDLILRLHRLLGNRWSLIAGRIPGRTDNEIKNYWNTHLSKKLISLGIDPRTHKPLKNNNDHQNQSSSAEANPNKASSSSKAKPRTNPNTNPNPNPVVSSHLEDHHDDTTLMMMNTSQQHLQLDHESGHGFISLLNGEDENSGHHHNEEDEDINYCGDDILSSFLNSLINEDAFAAQHQALQLQQQHQHNQSTGNTAQLPDSLVSNSASAFGLGASWESPIMASSFSHNEHKGVMNDSVD